MGSVDYDTEEIGNTYTQVVVDEAVFKDGFIFLENERVLV